MSCGYLVAHCTAKQIVRNEAKERKFTIKRADK